MINDHVLIDRIAERAATMYQHFTGDEIDWEQLNKAINTALRAIKDQNGQPIDRASRRRLALAAPKTSGE